MFNNYTLADMLLFSSDTYVRLFELYNVAIWPLHVTALIFTSGLLAAIWYRSVISERFARLTYVTLALCWVWVAYAFHLEHYANINWAAKGYGVLFAAEGILLLAAVVLARPASLLNSKSTSARIGRLIFLTGILVWPIASIALSGNWRSIQLFALTPDPTAIATLGFLMLATGRAKYLLSVIPLIWCLISAATHWAMFTA